MPVIPVRRLICPLQGLPNRIMTEGLGGIGPLGREDAHPGFVQQVAVAVVYHQRWAQVIQQVVHQVTGAGMVGAMPGAAGGRGAGLREGGPDGWRD